MTPSLPKKKLYLILSVVAIIVIMLLIIVPIVLNNNSSDSTTTETTTTNGEQSSTNETVNNSVSQTPLNGSDNTVITISNVYDYVTNLPASEVEAIDEQLTYTAIDNGVQGVIDDAVVRDGSYQQSIIDYDKMIYRTTFIVDLPSQKQSYVVDDRYSPLPPEQTGLVDYTTLVLCPDKSQLIYGEFNCTDRIIQEQEQ